MNGYGRLAKVFYLILGVINLIPKGIGYSRDGVACDNNVLFSLAYNLGGILCRMFGPSTWGKVLIVIGIGAIFLAIYVFLKEE